MGDHPNFNNITTITVHGNVIFNIFGCILALIGITHNDEILTIVGVIISLVAGLVFAGLLSIPVIFILKEAYNSIKSKNANKRQQKNDIHKV